MTCKDCKHCHTLKTLENKEWKYSYVCTLWLDLKEKGAYLLSVSENDTCECFDRKDVFLKTCPFCGGTVSISFHGSKGTGYWWSINRGLDKDTACKCRFFMESDRFDYNNKERVAEEKFKLSEKWNKRYEEQSTNKK